MHDVLDAPKVCKEGEGKEEGAADEADDPCLAIFEYGDEADEEIVLFFFFLVKFSAF